MAYSYTNFKTKKAFKEAHKAARELNRYLKIYQPNADITGHFFHEDKEEVVEGPHYPEPHKWYARVRVKKDPILGWVIDRIIA